MAITSGDASRWNSGKKEKEGERKRGAESKQITSDTGNVFRKRKTKSNKKQVDDGNVWNTLGRQVGDKS